MLYFLYAIITSLIIFFIGPSFGILDIRFMPFFQTLITIIGTISLYKIIDSVKAKELLLIILLILLAFIIKDYNKNTSNWIKWNYEGFEGKETWKTFYMINSYLKTHDTGRVLYEHSGLNNVFGTLRAFESLPYFAKRNTLEGLYMMASITSPFVFYIEGETSEQPCHPYPNYFYPTFSIDNAISHLKLFNVSHFIVRTNFVKNALAINPNFKLEKTYGDYSIYSLLSNSGQYVEALKNYPVLFKTNNWRKTSYLWFANEKLNDTYLVFLEKSDPNFKAYASSFDTIKTIPINSPVPIISSKISDESINIRTSDKRCPLLIKISYHPNWHVAGADKIYLVSPCFMLIFPKNNNITLTFEKGFFDYLGLYFTIFGLIILFLQIPYLSKIKYRLSIVRTESLIIYLDNRIEGLYKKINYKHLVGILAIFISIFIIVFVYTRNNNSFYVIKRARAAYSIRNYQKARSLFNKVISLQDNLGADNEARLFYALTYNGEGQYKEGLKYINEFINYYPNSFWTPQAYFEKAWTLGALREKEKSIEGYKTVINKFPNTVWKKYSIERLKEFK